MKFKLQIIWLKMCDGKNEEKEGKEEKKERNLILLISNFLHFLYYHITIY